MPRGLNPGDKVVVLDGAARSAALISGAVTGAIAGWIGKRTLTYSGIAFIVGAFLGWAIGSMVGRFLFPARDGNVVVAKWGRGSLPLTLKGSIIASVTSAFAVCVLAVLIVGGDLKTVAAPSIGASIIIGVVFAILASLT
jgi:hypothetical protein